jgi:REP element-mobilizing transposase RayT
VDLSRPYESKSGRYWYNLHLVLVADERYRTCERDILTKIRDTVGQICKKKGYLASAFAVMPDHLHLAIRGAIEQPPSEIALAFLNNLAQVLVVVDGGKLDTMRAPLASTGWRRCAIDLAGVKGAKCDEPRN